MATKFNIVRDISGYNGFGLLFSDTNYSATISANTATSLTIPSNMGMGGNGISTTSQWIAVFSYDPGTSVWVANNTTAAVPVGSSFASTQSQLNPTARLVKGGDVLSFISSNTTVSIGVALYLLS